MKKIAILGSTGSIGTQALDVARLNKDSFSVTALACGDNISLLKEQIKEFNPSMVSVKTEEHALEIGKLFPRLDVHWGKEGLEHVAEFSDATFLLNAVMGMRGMVPTYKAIKAHKTIALANKETLVAGGELIMEALKNEGVTMLPVDSEHSAIFQSLQGAHNPVKRILLTASGGPFRGYSLAQLKEVTIEQALKHPNWSMGRKITIDSATMMNKGLEIIEAKWLFDVDAENIEVHVHPQSIVHSAVEFFDNSVIAQMGTPDMKIPISYAMTYPKRKPCGSGRLDLFSFEKGLTFEPVDRKVFKCVDLAYEAIRMGKSYPAALNGANEVLVDMFLRKEISFIDIQNTLIKVLDEHKPWTIKSIEDVEAADEEIRRRIKEDTL